MRTHSAAHPEQPRERFRSLGPRALTVPELLAILIGSGTAEHDAGCVARTVLRSGDGTLRGLSRRPTGYLARVPGIGPVKAVRIGAALELGRRLAQEGHRPGQAIGAPADVHAWCGPQMRDLTVEEFHVLALDAQNRIVRQILITRGILNGSLVHPREVFRAAIAEAAAGIIAVHNHPSGLPVPSPEDKSITVQLVEAGRLLEVPVFDHVIIGGDRYFSFAEAGLL